MTNTPVTPCSILLIIPTLAGPRHLTDYCHQPPTPTTSPPWLCGSTSGILGVQARSTGHLDGTRSELAANDHDGHNTCQRYIQITSHRSHITSWSRARHRLSIPVAEGRGENPLGLQHLDLRQEIGVKTFRVRKCSIFRDSNFRTSPTFSTPSRP